MLCMNEKQSQETAIVQLVVMDLICVILDFNLMIMKKRQIVGLKEMVRLFESNTVVVSDLGKYVIYDLYGRVFESILVLGKQILEGLRYFVYLYVK